MTIAAFPGLKRIRPIRPNIGDATLRDFSGGLRVTNNELALRSKYATKLVNMIPNADASQSIRFGTKRFYTFTSGDIVGITYFSGYLIVVLSEGTIWAVHASDQTRSARTIWSQALAPDYTAATNDAPASGGWSDNLTSADFSEFRGKLIVTNGIDKPVIIDALPDTFVANVSYAKYLSDVAYSTNIFVPVTKYVATVANYVILANVNPNAPAVTTLKNPETTIYISSKSTSGTWPAAAPEGTPAATSDPDEDYNDSTSIDVGAYVGYATADIKGISSFKNFLVIFFDNFSVLLKLGVYNSEGAHTPEVVDTFENLGTINSKTIHATETDLVFSTNIGVYSLKRNIHSDAPVVRVLSKNLGNTYQETLSNVSTNDVKSFIANDPLSKTLFFFFYKNDDSTTAYAMRYNVDFSKVAWSEMKGWDFVNACTTDKGRLFFANARNIYQYGNSAYDGEDFAADYMDQAGTSSTPIAFNWEFPWIDAGNRIKTKILRKVTFDTTGTSEFSLQCFVNNFYKDEDDDYNPMGEMAFVAGNAGGYGANADGYGGDGYGGGRRANDERFFGIPMKFRILKMRIHGSTKEPLRVVSLSLIYKRGNYNL